jgi:hypothetical protein
LIEGFGKHKDILASFLRRSVRVGFESVQLLSKVFSILASFKLFFVLLKAAIARNYIGLIFVAYITAV